MEAEQINDFQNLTMQEKLKLWRMKTGKIVKSPRSSTKDHRKSPVELSCDEGDRRKSFITTARGREISKRKSLWSVGTSSPSFGAFCDDERKVSRSPAGKSPSSFKMRLIEDQNLHPNTDSSTVIMQKTRPIFQSPGLRNQTELFKSPRSESPRAHTSTPLCDRDFSGYFTADESIRDTSGKLRFSGSSRGSINGDSRRTSRAFMETNSSFGNFRDDSNMKISALESSLDHALNQVAQLREELVIASRENMICAVRLHSLEEENKDLHTKVTSSLKEIQAQVFLNSVLEQKNDEINHHLSTDRLLRNEHIVNKTRKFTNELQRLTNEKTLYEQRANEMCTQMAEQMSLLQQTAMERIEVILSVTKSHKTVFF